MITTKRTDRGRHYENHSAVPGTSSAPAGAPSPKGKASEEPDARTLCPMTRKVCLGRKCVHFDEDYDVCGMSPLSFYNQIRDAVIDAAVEIILTLAEGVIENLPKLIEKAPEIIQKLVDAIIENVPKLIDAAIEIIVKLTEGIIQNLPQLLESATQIVFTIAEGIVRMLGELVMKGKEIVDSVKNGIDQKVQDAKNWGRDLIANFIAGMKEKWENLKSSVSNIASTVKSFLGHSHPTEGPMKDDNTWMPDMMRSFAQGIRDNRGLVLGEMDKLANDMSGSMDWGSPAFAMAGGPAYNAGAGAGSAAASELRGIVDALRGMRVVLSTGETVGALTVPLNDSLGNQYSYSKRGI